jgi:uncharacterized membrane protein YphA (DoxX/SURF4 family)
MRELLHVSVAHAAGSYARKPKRLRWLAYPYAVLNLGVVAEWIGRGELFLAGAGTVVVMSPRSGRRSPRPAHVLVIAAILALTFAVPCAAAVLAVLAPAPLALPLIATMLLAYLLLVASYVVLALPSPRARDEKAAESALAAERRVVRLHDLVRSPDDARGSGLALLAGILRDPRFAGSAIVATAAHENLARRYEAAGMTRFRPGSLTVFRRA